MTGPITDESYMWILSKKRRQAAEVLCEINDMIAQRPHLAEGFSVDGIRLEIFRLEDTFPEKLKREKSA